jgi:release factor glutamine methyltransferase
MVKHGAKVAFMFLCCMKTVKDVSAAYRQALSAIYDPNEIEAITLIVLTELTGKSRAFIKAFPETELSTDQQLNAASWMDQLQTSKPLQYIVGHTEFYGLKFNVNPSVLIPRPETEELVEWIINEVRDAGSEDRITSSLHDSRTSNPSILDIGTGSGCLKEALACCCSFCNRYL